MYWTLIVIVVIVVAFFVWASADIGSGVYLKTLCRKHTDEPFVALTFDDGPDAVMTPRVLDVLDRYGVKAAFFLVGGKVRKYPDIVRRIVNDGHTVGNHTYTHSVMFPLSGGRSVRKEIEDTQNAVGNIAGIRMKLFRPPFGVTNPVIGKAVRYCGLQAIGWSVRSFDTFEGRDRTEVCRRIGRKLHNGAVLLLHDRCKDADVLLESVLKEIKARNMQVVTLDKLFDIEKYEN